MSYILYMSNDMNTETSRKSAHNAKVRARILQAAGKLFRAHGYDGVGLNDLMRAAGLTRGAFYAHFPSKAALFTAVMQDAHPILRKLQERTGHGEKEGDALWTQMREIFAAYLKFEHREEIWAGCSMAMLTHDVGRASAEAKAAQDQVLGLMEAEVIRGQGIATGDPRVSSALFLAFASVAQAKAAGSSARQFKILQDGAQIVFHLLEEARQPG